MTQEMLDAAFTQQWWGGVFVLNGDNVVVDRITTTHYESLETTVWQGEAVADIVAGKIDAMPPKTYRPKPKLPAF